MLAIGPKLLVVVVGLGLPVADQHCSFVPLIQAIIASLAVLFEGDWVVVGLS
jgi:hypothetical protein